MLVGWLEPERASSCGGWLCVCVCIRMDATISIIAFSTSMQFVSEKTCCLMLAGRYSKRMDKIENIPLTLFYGVGPTDDNRCAFSKAPTMKKICCGFVFEVGKRAGCDVISWPQQTKSISIQTVHACCNVLAIAQPQPFVMRDPHKIHGLWTYSSSSVNGTEP